MKKEIIIWQIIIVTLGLFLIFTIRQYLDQRLALDALIAEANCLQEADGPGIAAYCKGVHDYELYAQ